MTWFVIFMVIYYAIKLLLSISVVILNGLLLFACAKKRSLRTPSNAVLGCLCCIDLLIGIVTLALWVLHVLLSFSNSYYDIIEPFIAISRVYWMVTGLSSLFMQIVNLDRYAAICHPFKYMQYGTTKIYVIVSACICFFYALLMSVTYITDNLYNIHSEFTVFLIIFSAATITLIYCNWQVFKVLRRHRRQIESVGRISDGQCRGFQSETKRYRVILLLIILFAVCKLPHIIVYTLIVIVKVYWTFSFYIFVLVSDFLLLLNSLANPLVYYLRIRMFRNAVKEVFCCQRPV